MPTSQIDTIASVATFNTYLLAIVIFLIYSNTPIVLTNFHGAPSAIVYATILLLVLPVAYYFFIEQKPLHLTSALPWIACFLFADALLDRLLHHAQTVVIEGKSYRMKGQVKS